VHARSKHDALCCLPADALDHRVSAKLSLLVRVVSGQAQARRAVEEARMGVGVGSLANGTRRWVTSSRYWTAQHFKPTHAGTAATTHILRTYTTSTDLHCTTAHRL
jgi:hypothetical protein